MKNISSFCFWGCIVSGVVLSAAVYIFVENVVQMLNATGEVAVMVGEYLRIFSISGVFILLSNCFAALVRAEGKPKKAMNGMMIGNLINIVLDPILILSLDMGVKGAALATLIGNVCSGLYYVILLYGKDTMLSHKIKYFKMSDDIFKTVMLIGIPASLSSILMSVSQMLINGEMAQYGDLAVAGIGVAMKTTMLTTMVCIGIGLGVQPLLGFAIGSNNKERYHSIFKFSMIFAFCLSGILTLICYLGLEHIVNAFVTDVEAFDYAYTFSAVLISTSVIVSMLFVLANALQAAGAAKAAFVLNVSRQGFIYIPMLYILGGTVGINGLVYAQLVSDVIAIILAYVIYKKVSVTFFSDADDIVSSGENLPG